MCIILGMKYSEAIRLGSMLGPQGFGFVGTRVGDGTLCANQAALAALGSASWTDLLTDATPDCPVCGKPCKHLAGMVAVCLNDKHRWTREEIADWLVASSKDFEIELAPKVEKATSDEARGTLCATST